MSEVELSSEQLGSNKKEVIAGDFVISRLRSYLQEMAVIQPKDFRQLLSTEYLVYRAKTDFLSTNTIMVFALSKEVQTILNHSQYGTEHPRFYDFVLNEMPIPNALLGLNDEIDLIMKKAYQKLESSKAFYKEAENLLYESLGLDSKNPLESLMRDTLATTCHTEALAEVSKNDSVDLVESKDTHAKAPSAERGGTKELHSAREGEKESCHDLKSPLPQHEGHLGMGSNCGDNVYCHLKRSEVSHHKDRNSSVASLPQNDKDRSNLNNSPSSAEGARGWVNTRNDDIATKYPHLNISIRQLSQSYGKSGRLDSEYYQSKYDAIERIIKSYETIKLKNLAHYPISSGATPKAGGDDYTDSNQGIPFLRAVDLKFSRIETSNLIYIKPQVHKTTLKRTQLKKGDVLFSIAGTIGRCAIFDYDFEANINQALSILRFDETNGILRLYLITFFNSQIGQIYLEKYSRQGLQTNLNLEEVGDLEIPKINSTVQEQIASKIQKSFVLRKEAKDLLESAKSKVEHIIEKSYNK